MKKYVLISVLIIFSLLLISVAHADSYTSYSSSYAVNYATNNYDRPYGSSSGQNPFGDYSNLYGGNCTNFVSQAIIGGMINSNSAITVYGRRGDFDIDADGGYYQWYYINDSNRGPAFTGADKLYEYAINNYPNYKGLHFEYVTHDTLTEFMDYKAVEIGDVIFADWNHDGTIDHSMLVTATKWWLSGYNEIRLTYQGRAGVIGVTDIGLGDINEEYNYQAVFHVYRPVDYNPAGL